MTLGLASAQASDTFRLSSTRYSVSEGAGSAVITITRSSARYAGIVRYIAIHQTADAYADYTPVKDGVEFAKGQYSATFSVPIGPKPTTSTGFSRVDAFVWIGNPGRSGGPCHGSPVTGVFWPAYAMDSSSARTSAYGSPQRAQGGSAGGRTVASPPWPTSNRCTPFATTRRWPDRSRRWSRPPTT